MTSMLYDYYAAITERMKSRIEKYHMDLRKLEHALENAVGSQRHGIRRQIRKEKENLQNEMRRQRDSPMQLVVSGMLDEVSVWFQAGSMPRKEDAREIYLALVRKETLGFPVELTFEPNFFDLPCPRWTGVEIHFTLQTPWYSKDDQAFHVLDNPVRKDRVFGVPYMSAASWKGLLRWAFRMTAGLLGPKWEADEERRKIARSMDLHLFGNEKGAQKEFRQGALAFYPTWFDKVGFEVINPHSRARRAGTQPIYYEVVPAGTPGILRFLYAPLPGAAERDHVKPAQVIDCLLQAVEVLLTIYGISAKRTVGWGTAAITQWKAYKKGQQPISKQKRADFWSAVQIWLEAGENP